MDDTRKIAAEYRLSHWAKVMQRRRASGESIKSFCESEGIHQNVYFYWQRKLRAAACSSLVKAQTLEKALAPTGWTQLAETAPPVIVQNSLAIEVGGCRIIVNSETDPELMAKICRTLRLL